MKIATWNINSVRMRLQHLRDFLTEVNPDILLLQEIKCETEKFPFDELSDLSYNCYVYGQKSYNGVAILSKFPADEILEGLPNMVATTPSTQARMLEITLQTPIGFCKVISLYAPNGGSVGSEQFAMKLNFYDNLINYLTENKALDTKMIIGGDFNIAPFDIDVYSVKELQNSICFTKDEKLRLRTLLNSGFEDSYRLLHPNKQEFSWWDYRARSFERNNGLRIDMILASSNAIDRLDDCRMYYNYREKVKPSDHIPVIATFV